jgi:hypothetical protein
MSSKAKPAGSDASLLPKEVGVRLKQLRLEVRLIQSDMKQAVITLFADMERRGELD